jgi:nucleoside-diphosphate-sugar epimerase
MKKVLISVDELVDIVSCIARQIVKRHDFTRPQGVRCRNSDNSRLRRVLGWERRHDFESGSVPTCYWIVAQCRNDRQTYATSCVAE